MFNRLNKLNLYSLIITLYSFCSVSVIVYSYRLNMVVRFAFQYCMASVQLFNKQ